MTSETPSAGPVSSKQPAKSPSTGELIVKRVKRVKLRETGGNDDGDCGNAEKSGTDQEEK